MRPPALAGACTLPAERAPVALERADDAARDPAAVVVARLRDRLFVADPGLVDATRVEREVACNRLVARVRALVRPRDIGNEPRHVPQKSRAHPECPVRRGALPLADRRCA